MVDRNKLKRLIVTKRALVRIAILGILLTAPVLIVWFTMIRMPGKSYRGTLPPLSAEQAVLRDELQRDLEVLAGEIGERHTYRYDKLVAAVDFLEHELRQAGYDVGRQTFEAHGRECVNLDAQLTGQTAPHEIVIVGGHYDSVYGCPGANDNGTGAVATVALARRFAETAHDRTIRFCLFVNEEPPHFQTDTMGSLVYANRCRERDEQVVAMLSLETIGCYFDAKGSQHYPSLFGLFYPSEGNFIAFVGNYGSRRLVRRAVRAFRGGAKFPSEGGALPGGTPGVGWSDHWAFWQAGYHAIMVTDTAPFRYPHYHKDTDTPDKIDYDRMTRVVDGLGVVVRELARR